jgi:hypothetical protein
VIGAWRTIRTIAVAGLTEGMHFPSLVLRK